jgi:hypothetical protein
VRVLKAVAWHYIGSFCQLACFSSAQFLLLYYKVAAERSIGLSVLDKPAKNLLVEWHLVKCHSSPEYFYSP